MNTNKSAPIFNNMDKVCRLCLHFQPINDQINVIHSDVLEKLQSCFRIKISSAKSLPSHICTNCRDFIERANNFRNTVIINEEKLLETLENGEETEQQFKLNEIKYEAHDSCDNISVKEIEKDIVCEDKIKTEDDSLNCFDDNSVPYNVNINANPLLIDKEELTETECRQHTFKCLTCFENYESITVLRSHYRNIHLIKDRKKYSQYSIVKEDKGSNIFKCDMCGKSYDEKKYIVRHLQSHDEDRPLLCKVCGRTYKTVSEIILHDRAHNDSKLICSFKCGFSTSYSGALKVHEKGHRKEYKYKCKKCDRGFHVKTWYLQHQNQHIGVKPFVCDVCGLSFYMDRYLQSHKNSAHMQLTKIQRYVCVHCSFPCASKYAMKKHLKEHGIISSFLCDICGKTLSSTFQLRAHKITHAKVKPYSCSTCCKTFARKFNLNLHEGTHSGKKRHICMHCNKPFTQKSSLTRHISGHHSAGGNKSMK